MAEIIKLKRWKVPFVSLGGVKYDVRIYSNAGEWNEQDAVVLTGAAEPFVTEEDDGDDVLQAVRSSSGYINIVTDDYTLMEQMVPSTADGMRVTLVRHAMEDETDQADRVMWEGYVQPTAFSQEWAAGPWEIQVPVVSRLGMVMDDYLSSGNTGLLTVREWLGRVCGNVYKSVLIPHDELSEAGTMEAGGETVPTPTVLQLAFSEERFKTPIALADRENKENVISGMWDPSTNADIAMSLCTALRWVLRADGDTLICEDPGYMGDTYLRYPRVELMKESPQWSEAVSVEDMDTDELGTRWEAQIGGDDGSKDIIRPYGRVTVEGAGDKYSSTLVAMTPDWEKAGGVPPVNGAPASMNRPDTLPFDLYGDDSVTILSQKVRDNVELESYRYMNKTVEVAGSSQTVVYPEGLRMDGTTAEAGFRRLGDTSMLYGCAFPYVIFGKNADDMPHGDYLGGGEVAAVHYHYERGGVYTHYRFNSIVLGRLDTTSPEPKPALKIRSSLAQLLPCSERKKKYPCLKISGVARRGVGHEDVDIASDCGGEGMYGMQVSVKVGDTYIVKDTWGSHRCTLTKTEAPFDILWSKHQQNGFSEFIRLGQTEGFPLALDAPVEVTIYTPTYAERGSGRDLANGCKWLRIDNFTVEVTEQEDVDMYDFNPTLVEEPDSGIGMSEMLGSNKLEEYTLSTQLGSVDNPGALLAWIPDAKNRLMQARKVGSLEGAMDGARYLCQRTWEWMKVQGMGTREVLTIPLRGMRIWSFPQPMRVGHDSRGFYVLSMKREWRDDKVMLKMVEVR